MILNCVRVTAMPMMAVPSWRSTCCCASSSSSSSVSTINTDQLRSQLDHLHSEADATRAKEVAEKLQKQAAISIQKGQENYAREMLFQRKKVLQALDKSKRRIEVLDELSSKLSEAISLKESQLIGNVTVKIEDTTEDASSPVRIIAPKEEVQNNVTKDESDPDTAEFGGDIQDVQLSIESEGSSLDDKETQHLLESLSISTPNEENIARNSSEISSYEDFMEYIDLKLSEIEAELVTVLNVSTLVLDNEERAKNSRLQQTIELLDSIHGIRQRIRNTKEAKVRI
ncbi:hypothetical protein GmHk_14G039944 [Glycine max]|nr:hypothetical protein GmHk_14G039944 [Glycine max]